MRLFYAVFLPQALQEALREAQSRLAPFKGWKPVPPHQFHLTLVFLGEVREEFLPELVALGARVGRTHPPFRACLRGTGYFPNEGTPRVWFANAQGEGFSPLAEALRAGAVDLGLSPDAKPFKPHITLARRKAPAPRVGPVLFGQAWWVDHFALVRSELRPRGPIYTILERFPLLGERKDEDGRDQEEASGKRA